MPNYTEIRMKTGFALLIAETEKKVFDLLDVVIQELKNDNTNTLLKTWDYTAKVSFGAVAEKDANNILAVLNLEDHLGNIILVSAKYDLTCSTTGEYVSKESGIQNLLDITSCVKFIEYLDSVDFVTNGFPENTFITS